MIDNVPLLVVMVLVLSIIVELACINKILPMLERGGSTRANYRNHEIPVAGGITFLLTILVVSLVTSSIFDISPALSAPFLTSWMGMCFLGFVDDMLGQRDSLGFRGHFGRLFTRGELTTGALKAIGGGIVAIWFSLIYSTGIGDIVVNTLLIALFTNSMNLFDLRPGRCIKFFLLFFIPLLFFTKGDYIIFLPLLGVVLAWFPYDVGARGMMGDAGSNLLGVSLGMMAAISLPIAARIILVIALIGLHIITERYSLTKVIAANPTLRWFDNLGRGV